MADAAAALVIAGSYEGGLHGWAVEGTDYALKFSFAAHQGCCRCVATNGHIPGVQPILLTGGDDELIRAYSLATFKMLGELARHKGTITCLCFCGKKHFASASADGTILLWRLKEWTCVHVLGGHDKPVHSISPHPSGRMLLSTGADRTLRLWDLVEGRSAHITRTKGEATKVCWGAGEAPASYLVVLGARVEVLDVETSTLEFEVDVGAIVIDAVFLAASSFVATADGAGVLSVWGSDGCLWRRRRRGGGRVKALSCLRVGPSLEDASLEAWAASFRLVAAASSGAVEAWAPTGPADDADGEDDAVAPDSVAADTTARLTCLAVHAAPSTRALVAPKPPQTKAPKAAAPEQVQRPRSHSGEAPKRDLKDKMKRKRPRSRGVSS